MHLLHLHLLHLHLLHLHLLHRHHLHLLHGHLLHGHLLHGHLLHLLHGHLLHLLHGHLLHGNEHRLRSHVGRGSNGVDLRFVGLGHLCEERLHLRDLLGIEVAGVDHGLHLGHLLGVESHLRGSGGVDLLRVPFVVGVLLGLGIGVVLGFGLGRDFLGRVGGV